MSINFVQPGNVLEFTAPSGGVTAGVPVLINGLVVIPTASADAGDTFRGATQGVFTLSKTSLETWTVGQAAFWDAANAAVSNDPAVGHLPIGAITEAAGSSATTGSIRLNGESLSGRMYTRRKRFTVAQVNAGATLLPAIAGAKYRMVDAMAIAVGGAVGAVTTVDVLGTLTTSQKLVAFAQANLTQNAVIRAGGTGGAVLAGGASFIAMDAGAAITVGKTGDDVTTATHVDVSITYTIE